MSEQTILVYDDGRLLHLPSSNAGTPLTACGVDAGAYLRKERPASWAGMWCPACMKAVQPSIGGNE